MSIVCIFVLSGLLWSIFLLFLVRLLSGVCFHILANTKPNWIVVTCYRWCILEILSQKIPAVVTQFAIYTSTQYTLFDIPPPPSLKMCISSVFNFFWNDWNTQEKRKTKLCIVGGRGRGEGGQIRCIVANEVYCGKCANKSIARWRTLTSTARILIKVSPYQCSKTLQNGGQVGIPNQTCGRWTPFLHKNFPFCSNELAIKLLAS